MSLHKKAIECGITPSSREENEALFHRILAGKAATEKVLDGKAATKRLVEGNMAYVVSKVDSFLDEHPNYGHFRDDLISEGFLQLVRIAEDLNARDDTEVFNPQGLINVSLQNRFLDFVSLHFNQSLPLTDEIAETLLYEEETAIDLKLDILSCCQDDTERTIVEHRSKGLTDEQIADLLGVHRLHVFRIRAKIYKEYQERIHDQTHSA